ncbi:MAG: ATP-binding cassette domain-containing protein, partial [Slackia sp.]|nr:ATP-binding cassette domain-containing protein [Slackia sp.]
MIELKNVSFSYGADDAHRAIDGVSLQVPDGTCTILCGRSGSGKSTVMRVVEGLAPGFFPGRREGSVHVAGKDPHAMSPSEKARL